MGLDTTLRMCRLDCAILVPAGAWASSGLQAALGALPAWLCLHHLLLGVAPPRL